jgi:threonine/homoserine efflux transporter RhtA
MAYETQTTRRSHRIGQRVALVVLLAVGYAHAQFSALAQVAAPDALLIGILLSVLAYLLMTWSAKRWPALYGIHEEEVLSVFFMESEEG